MAEETFWWLVVTVGATLGMISMLLAQAGDRTPIYLDPNRPVEERVDDLMSRMTLKEKVGQLNFPDLYAAQIKYHCQAGGLQTIHGGDLYPGHRPGWRLLLGRRLCAAG